ncbi:hypothetical protein JYU34_009451 [Plutella xylostella]|uniref:Uncharacterized protein n=1 Tax=Plutella xylostella TaxID=51655 RepID=A0ABQ7QKS8_PLUXY|nr:hypothetical protein JYU34_009451 [Plutella xylostella]
MYETNADHRWKWKRNLTHGNEDEPGPEAAWGHFLHARKEKLGGSALEENLPHADDML